MFFSISHAKKDKIKFNQTDFNKQNPSNDTMMLALEPRLLFDAAGLIAGLDLMPQADGGDGGTPYLIPELSKVSPDSGSDLLSDLTESVTVVPPAAGQPASIVFIDAGVTGHERLLDDLPADALAVILEAGSDGITQIGDTLAQHEDIGAIHIISHGNPGNITLGDTVLSNNTIGDYAAALQGWGSSLAEGADILVYGCNVAQGIQGQSFVAQLSDITGADVAASDDITGTETQNGDWDLEARTGIIESDTIESDRLVSGLIGPPPTEITVDQAGDGQDVSTNGVDYSDGLTLREALMITENNNSEGKDTINFDAAQTITLNYGALYIIESNGVTINGDIDGDGNADITLDGNNASRIFNIDSGADATVNGLNITGGYESASDGGGILNKGSLTIHNSKISGNETRYYGGGIKNWSGANLKIYDSTISENEAISGGGGIINSNGTLNIFNSTISGNKSYDKGGGLHNSYGTINVYNSMISENTAFIHGGGIDNSWGTLNMFSSTVSENEASYFGGGIYNWGGATLNIFDSMISKNENLYRGGGGIHLAHNSTVTIDSSTVSGNVSNYYGGGLYNTWLSTLNIYNSTISDNEAKNGGGGIDNQGTLNIYNSTISGNKAVNLGGGINNYDSAYTPDNAKMTVYHSTIADNTALSGSAIYTYEDDGDTQMGHTIVDGGIVTIIDSQGYNLFTQAGVTGAIASDFLGANADLQPLADNGSSTLTHALGSDSDAFEAGNPSGSFSAYDQRGAGYVRVLDTIDIGSVEMTNRPPTGNQDSIGTDEDMAIAINVLANDMDMDGNPLSLAGFDTTGTKGVVSNNGDGTFTYRPNGRFDYLATGESATDTFVYTVSDGNGLTDDVTVTITITGVNDNPEASNDSFSTNADTAVTTGSVLANDTDPDTSDSLIIENVYTSGTKGIVTSNGNGTFSYDPNGQFDDLEVGETATDAFIYTASDGNGGSDPAVVTITISGVNNGPEANDDHSVTMENTPVTMDILANDTHPDGSGSLTVSGYDSTGTRGIVTGNGDGTFTYNPNGQFDDLGVGETATDTFTYTVSDGSGGTDTAMVTITISGVKKDGTGLIFNTPTADASFADLITDPQKTGTPWYQIWTGNEAGSEGDYVDTTAFHANGNGWVQGDDLASLFPDYCQAGDTTIWVRSWTQTGGNSAWATSAMPFDLIDSVNTCDSVTGPMPMDQMFNDENASSDHWYRIWIGDGAEQDSTGSFLDTSALNNGAGQGWIRASELADISFTPDEPGTSQELWVQAWSPAAGNLGWEHWTVTCTEADETAQVLEPDTGLDVVENGTQLQAAIEPITKDTARQQISEQTAESTGMAGFNEQLQIAGNIFERQRTEFLDRLSA